MYKQKQDLLTNINVQASRRESIVKKIKSIHYEKSPMCKSAGKCLSSNTSELSKIYGGRRIVPKHTAMSSLCSTKNTIKLPIMKSYEAKQHRPHIPSTNRKFEKLRQIYG